MSDKEPIKIDKSCNNELQKIEWEIWNANKRLNELKMKEPQNDIILNQISELEAELKKLETEKEKIVKKTRCSLKWEKVWKTELAWKVEKSNLSKDEKQKVQTALKDQWENLDLSKIEWGWILWLLLAIFQAFSWWFKNYAEIWADGREITDTWTDYKNIIKSKSEFIKITKEFALKNQEKYWIPWEVTISQAWLESNWWKSLLSAKYNNFFWIKSFSSTDKYVTLMTTEEENGQKVRKPAKFKVFDSIEDSFEWHAKFLKNNKRYSNAFNYSDDPTRFAIEIAKAWYATDSNYASKIAWLSKEVKNVA